MQKHKSIKNFFISKSTQNKKLEFGHHKIKKNIKNEQKKKT